MKKLFVLISMLIVVAACTAPSTNQGNVNTSTAYEKPSAPAMTEADAIAKEKAVWDTVKNKDYDAFGNMLANDEMEVTADGVLQKAGSVSMVKDFEPSEITFSDWKFLSIDKDAWVITYTVNVKGKYKGKEMTPATVRGSSAWAYRDGKWIAVYHQECDVMNMPPPPPAATKKAAAPATTPASITTTSDVIANEKMVWDFFKAGQFDAFASILATDAIEVEPNGVFDRAGIVKGIKDFDFSKTTTSEFKSLSIDSDAALVTYLLTNPGAKPEQERHSTIWAMRGGKWLAVFHHGTPAAHAMNANMPGMSMSPGTHAMTSPSPK
ncbi:MAG: nuclear transport factor 2 family protein [bacterium]